VARIAIAPVWWSILLGGFAILAFCGGDRVWQVNREMTPDPVIRDIYRPIRAVNLFVKKHRMEPDFTFDIDYATSDKIPKTYGVPVTLTIFNRWHSGNPKYWIAIRDGKAWLLPGRPEGGSNDVPK
jgi:hypothetical protein